MRSAASSGFANVSSAVGSRARDTDLLLLVGPFATVWIATKGAEAMADVRDRVRDHCRALTRVREDPIQKNLTDCEEHIFPTVGEAAESFYPHKLTLAGPA